MEAIKFGTDGWRAIIAKEFTVDNVAKVAQATANWLLNKIKTPSVVIGHDCRFAGELFVETTAKVLAQNGIKVYLAKGFVSTPMVSLGIIKHKADLGVVITASHNPPTYSGYKLKGNYGGPLLEEDIHDVEKFIPAENKHDIDLLKLEIFEKKGLIKYVDLESMYCKQIEDNFDLKAIKKSGFEFAFDAMYGAGQNVMRRLFPDITLLHCEENPMFDNIPPEPLHKNLLEFSELIKLAEEIDCGLAVDGDADRIALYDNEGNYVDSHHIILLLIHYLYKYKGWRGKVCTGFSSTVKIKKLCEHYGLKLDIVHIGFKHICGIMLKEDVLVGGEESGGIAVKGHIPERDGIWNGMVIWEAMAKTKKTLTQLLQEVYDITGTFAFERSDLRLDESLKNKIVENCKNGYYKAFGKYKVQWMEDLDGFKYYFNDDEWVMIRPSGTEPLLRTYAESHTQAEALEILKITYDTLMKDYK
jgi:phosphomannomutase